MLRAVNVAHKYTYSRNGMMNTGTVKRFNNIKGYGLGLSYVNHIIQRHMGFIEVKSELGKGSTFIVNIPTKQVDVIRFNDHRLVR